MFCLEGPIGPVTEFSVSNWSKSKMLDQAYVSATGQIGMTLLCVFKKELLHKLTYPEFL